MSERMPVEPETKALNPDDDTPDVEGHRFHQPVDRAALNPDADELDKAGPGDKAGPSEKF